MRIQNLNAIRERIRQVKFDLARLRMLEKLAHLEHRHVVRALKRLREVGLYNEKRVRVRRIIRWPIFARPPPPPPKPRGRHARRQAAGAESSASRAMLRLPSPQERLDSVRRGKSPSGPTGRKIRCRGREAPESSLLHMLTFGRRLWLSARFLAPVRHQPRQAQDCRAPAKQLGWRGLTHRAQSQWHQPRLVRAWGCLPGPHGPGDASVGPSALRSMV